MKNFSRAYTNEVVKLNPKKDLIILCAIMLGMLILVTVGFNLIADSDLGSILGSMTNMDETELNYEIEMIEAQIKNYKSPSYVGLTDNTLYTLKSRLAFLEYVRDNDVNLANKTVFGSGNIDSSGYLTTVLGVFSTIILIYACVSAVKNFHMEKVSGALKMEMMRPVKRSSLLMSKMLAVWSISSITFVIFTLIAIIISMIKFDIVTKDVIYILNATKVGEMSFLSYMILTIFYNLVQIWCYMQLAYFISSIFWKKQSCTALVIVLILLGSTIDQILSFIYVGYAGFFNNINFLSALNVESAPACKGSNLYSMLAFTILYQVGFTLYNFMHFNRCDIA